MKNRKTSGARSALRAADLAGRPGAGGMRNRLKGIGLALCAALSVLAIGAASAHAAAPEFHAEEAPVIFEGPQVVKHVVTVNGGTVSCKKAEFINGTNTTKTSTTVELTPIYLECTAFGRAQTWDTNDCKYMFHLVAGSSPPTATVDITGCNAGSPGIVVTVPSLPCNVTIPEQTGIKQVTFKSEGSGATRDILATLSLSGIKYTENGTGCLGAGVGTQQSNGTMTGTTTIKGFKDTGGAKGAQQGVWVE